MSMDLKYLLFSVLLAFRAGADRGGIGQPGGWPRHVGRQSRGHGRAAGLRRAGAGAPNLNMIENMVLFTALVLVTGHRRQGQRHDRDGRA